MCSSLREKQADGFGFKIMQIWFLISEEARKKVKALMPKTWYPPRDEWQPIKTDFKLESPEEIDRLMRKPPKHQKRVV